MVNNHFYSNFDDYLQLIFLAAQLPAVPRYQFLLNYTGDLIGNYARKLGISKNAASDTNIILW